MKKKTCKELHPTRKINLGFICCNEAFRKFRATKRTIEELLEIIESSTSWVDLGLDEFTMYGVKRDNQFEGYGRATECNEIPWHGFISKVFCGEELPYESGDCKSFREALEWLAFHLERLANQQ